MSSCQVLRWAASRAISPGAASIASGACPAAPATCISNEVPSTPSRGASTGSAAAALPHASNRQAAQATADKRLPMVIPGLVSSVAGGCGSRPRLPACGRRQAGINGVNDRVVVAIGAVDRALAGDLVFGERHPAVLVRISRPEPPPGLPVRAVAEHGDEAHK